MNFKLEEYRNWLEINTELTDAFSEKALRKTVLHLLMGRNYRLLIEKNTKGKLLTTYLWLSELREEARLEFGEEWIIKFLEETQNTKKKPKEISDLLAWILGLTSKTATNLGISKTEYPSVLIDTINFFNELFEKTNKLDFKDDAWLLLMAGSATLTIRGSQKSKVGKLYEKVFIKSALTILGLEENVNFWVNMDRDNEVDRESDAEVETKRGRVRIEIGLIAPGNQEVIEDKIGRVGRNGIIIFDKLGKGTRVYETAAIQNVKLIQIRNNNPLVELYRHLNELTKVELNKPKEKERELSSEIATLPKSIFNYTNTSS